MFKDFVVWVWWRVYQKNDQSTQIEDKISSSGLTMITTFSTFTIVKFFNNNDVYENNIN